MKTTAKILKMLRNAFAYLSAILVLFAVFLGIILTNSEIKTLGLYAILLFLLAVVMELILGIILDVSDRLLK